MLLHIVLFYFCFATSAGFQFGHIGRSAIVGTPFTLSWHLEKDDDPEKLFFERRLKFSGSGEGDRLPFQFHNGTGVETMIVNFPSPGDYLIEAFNKNTDSPIAVSNTILVSSPDSGINSGSITPSVTRSDIHYFFCHGSFLHLFEFWLWGLINYEACFLVTPSSAATRSGLTTDGTSTPTSTPSSKPNDYKSHKTKQMWTIIGAVIGVAVFLLLLALGVLHYYRVYRNLRHLLLPSPKVMLQYLQIRPSSQHGAIHKLRGRNVPVLASVDILRPTSINSGIVEFDVEEGVLGANLPGKGSELVTTHSLSLASDDDVPGPDPSLSEGLLEKASVQILTEEPTPHASTSSLPPRARNDEMVEEIIRLRTQIQQLIVDRVSGWDQNGEMDPPPAYTRIRVQALGFDASLTSDVGQTTSTGHGDVLCVYFKFMVSAIAGVFSHSLNVQLRASASSRTLIDSYYDISHLHGLQINASSFKFNNDRFCFCFATLIGFKFGDISADAIVGTPFTLTWYLDQGDDPHKLHFQQGLKSRCNGYSLNRISAPIC
ncbi:hypothetical protein ARMGADRAFT_1040714 [Armillaria gallica]|uniref:GOLD domain-containing protein n=1 Tax=Armillaria gallica TaxID=47427 RepID=A0A2H3CK18_ARMGA|nr:hypothetical protein ARMGADRAFT_1040714 [Armillaria gallica]